MKKLFLSIAMLGMILTPLYSFAVQNDFSIVPETQDGTNVEQDVEDVSKAGGSVWDVLNYKAQNYEEKGDLGAQFASGAFTWNTLLNYVVYLVRFLSQLALVIGAGMIIVAGYKYAAAAFTGKEAGSGDVKNAIIGVLIVIFSYALIRILTEAFL